MSYNVKLYKDYAEYWFGLLQAKCLKMSWSEQLTPEFFLGLRSLCLGKHLEKPLEGNS